MMQARRHITEYGWLTTTRRRRDSFALVATVILLTLLIAVSTQLATTTSIDSVISARRQHDLKHELARDSAILAVAERLDPTHPTAARFIADLDREGVATLNLKLGNVVANCVIQDDGAKFNPRLFQRDDQYTTLQRKLTTLSQDLGLPAAGIKLRPIQSQSSEEPTDRYQWFDQVVHEASPTSLFHWEEYHGASAQPVWSDALTFWGDGKVDVRRAPAAVLEATLDDLRPGLGRAIYAARAQDPSANFLAAGLAKVEAELRQQAAGRLTFNAHRYALTIDTRINADRRRWYIIAHIDGNQVTILHRSRITW
jgi:hypothetical protein